MFIFPFILADHPLKYNTSQGARAPWRGLGQGPKKKGFQRDESLWWVQGKALVGSSRMLVGPLRDETEKEKILSYGSDFAMQNQNRGLLLFFFSLGALPQPPQGAPPPGPPPKG